MSIVTDATPIEAPKDPTKCTLFALYRLFVTPEETARLRERYLVGGLKYSDVKKELIDIVSFLQPHYDVFVPQYEYRIYP